MDIPDYASLKKQSRRAKRDAEDAAMQELFAWHKAEKAKLDQDGSLSANERKRAGLELLLEFGRRSNRAMSKARRDNTVPKLLEPSRSGRGRCQARKDAPAMKTVDELLEDADHGRWPAQNEADAWLVLANWAFQTESLIVDETENTAWEERMRDLLRRELPYTEPSSSARPRSSGASECESWPRRTCGTSTDSSRAGRPSCGEM